MPAMPWENRHGARARSALRSTLQSRPDEASADSRPDPGRNGAPSTDGLAARLAAGNTGELGELHARVAPAVYGWALVRIPAGLRARLDPEDVLQEVLCRILARAGEFDASRGSFRSWVFGFARRVLHEALRRCAQDGAGGERLGLTDLALLPEEATSLTRRVARDETLRVFARRIEGLEAEERRLILLRGLEGLEHEDVAKELGITPTAAAKRWQRLRERLGGEFDALLSA